MSDLPYQTLHCHTTNSDGLLTYEQVLDECAINKIGVVAFTDHDAVPNADLLMKLRSRNHKVKFLSGIEVSANTVDEVEGQVGDFHIVGLFVNPTNKELINYCQIAQQKRIERVERILKNIQSLGFNVTMREINAFAGGESIGRPAIASAILAKEENLRILDQLLTKQEMVLTDGGYKQAIFDLFLDSRSIIPGIYVHYLNPTTMDQAVTIIRNAGGVALLGHWSFYKKKITAELVEKFCQEKRIDGIETVYAFGMSKEEKIEFDKDMTLVTRLVEKYNLTAGGGGDFHTKENFALMVDPRYQTYANNTIGMVEKILQKRPDLDLSWTTLSR